MFSLTNPLWSLLYRFGRPYWKHFAVGVAAQIASRFPRLFPTLLIGMIADTLLVGPEAYRLPLVPDAWLPDTTGGLMVLTLVLLTATYPTTALLNLISTRRLGRFDQRVQHDIRTGTFDTVQRLEMEYFDENETGQIMSILNDDVRQLSNAVHGVLRTAIEATTIAIAMFAFLLWLNWQFALTLLLAPILLAGLSTWASRILEPRHVAVRERVGAINDRLNNNVEGISVIKAYGTEDLERERVAEVSRDHKDAKWDLQVAQSTYDPISGFVTQGVKLLILGLGAYWVLVGPPLVYSGTLTAGALYAFYRYIGDFTYPVDDLAQAVDPYYNAKAAATRLRDAVDSDRVTAHEGAIDLETVDGAVEYDDVTFGYAQRDEIALEDVRFEVDPGETVGIVGPTGAGKSTLVKLLFRFYDPDRGRIEIDGRDLRDVTVESLRDALGYVSQDPFLFYGTVRENLLYAAEDVDEDEMVRAAKLAGAHEFVADLPEGYDTEIGERGIKLSGGQRQRVAIAREILRSPAILVLDEATSHVDNETEVLIQHSMEELGAERTMFVIAHRLSSVREADRILVIDDGRIVERGTHEELLADDGLYASLWRIQVGDVEALSEEFLERLRRQEVAE